MRYKGKHNLIMSKQTILFLGMMIPIFLFAQKKGKEQYVSSRDLTVKVDAELIEWENHLCQENSALWSFGLAVRGNTLFAAVKIKDKSLIEDAIRNGILLNISYSDKRKEGAQLIFPRMNLEKLENSKDEETTVHSFSTNQLIKSAKGYDVRGFEKIRDGLLSFHNTYGIRAVSKITSDGEMVYEAEIPLHLIKFQTDELAVQLGVITAYMQAQKSAKTNKKVKTPNVYGRRPASPAAIKNPYDESTDVWFTVSIK